MARVRPGEAPAVSMTNLVLAFVAGGAIFVAIFTLMDGRGDSSLAGLLDRIGEAQPAVESWGDMPDYPEVHERVAAGAAFRASLHRMGGSKVDKSKRGSQLSTKLLAAGLKLRPAEWLAITAGVTVLGGALAFVRFASPIALVVGGLLGYAGAQLYLRRRVSKRKKLFAGQLGPAVLSISNGVKAGYTFAQAIDLVGKNAPVPIGLELMRVTRETQLGVPIQEALAHMVVRNESEDLKLMLTAVQIQQQVGGNLAGILDSIEFTIRERVRIKGEIQTLTGQARASGWILIILPFALAGILQVIAPTYFKPMLTSGMGQGMLGLAAFSLLCGYGIIQKIVNVKI